MSLVDPARSNERRAGVAREMLGLLEDLSPGASTLTELRHYVSALVAGASGFHKQVNETPATSVRTLALMPDASVNGRFVPRTRTPPRKAPSSLRNGTIQVSRGLPYNTFNILGHNVPTDDNRDRSSLGSFSDKRAMVRSATATPVNLGVDSQEVIAPTLLPPSTAVSMLPSVDFEAPSDDGADLFDLSTDADK